MNYEEIMKQFKEVILYSQEENFIKLPEFNFESLFAQWYKNKTAIRQLLPFFDDNNFIYEYPVPVSFGLDENTKLERLNRFIRELWDFPMLQDFLRANKTNFFENRVVENYKAPYGTVRRGMKIIKAFKLFFSKDNEDLKRLQAEASAIMNEDKVEGTFCISIHPLDYISISDNDHNWHSCHAMNSDYRAGNLSYMADKHTVICYIKTGKDRKISNFPENIPWNSKRWRVLLFFDEECNFVMASKQYPVQSEEALSFFREVHKKAYEDKYKSISLMNSFGPWHKEQIQEVNLDGYVYKFPYPMIPIGQHMAPIHKIYVPGKNSLQYNDILRNDSYCKEVRYAYLADNSMWATYNDFGIVYSDNKNTVRTSRHLFLNNNLPILEIGKEVDCPVCGVNPISTSDIILCDRCALKYWNPDGLDEDYYPACDCCGDRFIHYEGTWHDGVYYCPSCAEEIKEEN